MNRLKIPYTIREVAKCWNCAEMDLRNNIETKHHDLDEEFITKLFYDEFCCQLNKASTGKQIERAFLADLQRAFPEILRFTLSRFSANLIAEAMLHKRGTEKVTGGDFGLVITCPQISYGWSKLIRGTDFHQGLLCQAKIRRRSGKWGSLTRNQEKVLPHRMKYLSLLLYSYSDAERCKLNPFQWQICRNKPVEDVKDWLRSNVFPNVLDSAKIIGQLGNAQIGTGDEKIVRQIITPGTRPYLNIKISWPDNKPPPSHVGIYASQTVQQQVKIAH